MLALPEISRLIVKSCEGDWQQAVQNDTTPGASIISEELTGTGKAMFLSGHRYEGSFLRGALHGQGSYTWRDGVVFNGEFKDNRVDGYGKYEWTDGCSYTGHVSSGLRHGTGVLECPDGFSYNGEWKHGRPNGKGRVNYSEHSYYDGDWLDGHPHGQGTMKYESGNIYEGSWVHGTRQGHGKMTWVDRGELYEGLWENGKQNGIGVYVWMLEAIRDHQNPTQNRYEGEWKDGKRHGRGVFFYASGAVYDGEWQNNRKHGNGKYISENGRFYIGAFQNDRPVDHFKPYSNEIPFSFSLPNVEKKDRTQVLKDVNAVIFRHIGDLRALYHKYSKEYEDEKHYRRKVLRRNDVWILLRDLKLIQEGFTLAELDRAYVEMLKDHPCLSSRYNDPHNPNTEFIFYDFLQFLLAVSNHVYHRQTELSIHESPLASSLSMLIKKNIHPTLSQKIASEDLVLSPFEQFHSFLRKEFEDEFVQQIYKISETIAVRGKKSLPRSMKDKTITVRNFLLALKDYGLVKQWSVNMPLSEIIQCFSEQMPLVMEQECYNLEFELVQLDIFDAIYRVSLKIAGDAVQKDLTKMLELAESSQVDWKEEYMNIKISDQDIRKLITNSPSIGVKVPATTERLTPGTSQSSKLIDTLMNTSSILFAGSKNELTTTVPSTPQSSGLAATMSNTLLVSTSKLPKVPTPPTPTSNTPSSLLPTGEIQGTVNGTSNQQRNVSVDLQGGNAILVSKANDADLDSSKASELQDSLHTDPTIRVHSSITKIKASLVKTFLEFAKAHELALKESQLVQRGIDRERFRQIGKQLVEIVQHKHSETDSETLLVDESTQHPASTEVEHHDSKSNIQILVNLSDS